MVIAVIDDGVNSGYFPEIDKLYLDLTIGKNQTVTSRRNYNKRLISHGTICAAIIKKYFKAAQIASIKILSPKTQRSTPEKLIEALRICEERNIKLVNMSIGSCQINDISKISEAVKRFQENGGIIIAALTNSMRWSVPACLEGVLSAKVDILLENDSFYPNRQGLHDVLFLASSNHTLRNYLGEDIKTQICNSYCTPVITAAVGKLLANNETLSRGKLLFELGIKKPTTYISRFKNTNFTNDEIDIPVIEVIGNPPENVALATKLSILMTSMGYPSIVCGTEKDEIAAPLGFIPKRVSVKKFISFHEKLLDLSAVVLIGEIYKHSDCHIFLSEKAKRVSHKGDDITLPLKYNENQLRRIVKYFE